MVTQLTPQAITVLEKRYLQKNEKGELIETPDEMFRRVAKNIAQAELNYLPISNERPYVWSEAAKIAYVNEWEEKFNQLMSSLDFLPNSPTLMNAGRELQQLAACYVLPVEDSIEGIFDAIKWQALIHKTGGGTGFSFSRLRPKDDFVQSTGQIASGPISFLRVFDAATQEIKQGGMRRGANMGILSCHHPDILEFITCKADMKSIINFNISVAITDEFMDRLLKCQWTVTNKAPHTCNYELVNPRNNECSGTLRAHDVWQTILDNAWLNGDPGLWFIDRVNAGKGNPVPSLGPIESCNPCGEAELYPFDVCTLGSINLSHFVTWVSLNREDRPPQVDWERLAEVIPLCIRFLDNVLDMNKYPLEQNKEMAHNIRRIGLGVMGWADMLIQLGIPYDSEEALKLGEEVMRFIKEQADAVSEALAQERGVFPAWEESIYGPEGMNRKLRNSTRTTIAPTGTISIIAGCSSGIEPLFALSYWHQGLEGGIKEAFVNPYLRDAVARHLGNYHESVFMPDSVVSTRDLLPSNLQSVFITSNEIAPEWHVKMQAAFQKYTDNAVSKTINFANTATRADVERAYLLAWETGCKGITIYRDGSRVGQALTTKKDNERQVSSVEPIPTTVIERSEALIGITYKQPSPFGNLYITINGGDEPLEVFVNAGKSGADITAMAEAIGRLASLVLRLGSSLPRKERLALIAEQLKGIGGSSSVGFGNGRVRSIPDGVAQAILKHNQQFPEGTVLISSDRLDVAQYMTEEVTASLQDGSLCPECGNALIFQEGCMLCQSCGFSQC